jgi:hypothetical protein
LGCEISGCGWFRSIRSMSAVRVSAARSPTPAKPLGSPRSRLLRSERRRANSRRCTS